MNEFEFRTKIKEISDDKQKIKMLYEYTKIAPIDSSFIAEIIYNLDDNELKKRVMNKYEFNNYFKSTIIKTFSDKEKKEIILENKYNLDKVYIIELLESLKGETIIELINEHMDFLDKINIKPYEIIRKMNEENQLKIVKNFQRIQLKEKDKLLIIATLNKRIKEKIDKTNLSKKYINALNIEINIDKYYADVDLNKDLEEYRYLDELIGINPTEFTKEEKERFLILCQICPNLTVRDGLLWGGSTTKEYINSEKWIKSVIEKIDPNWNDVQKLAYIDNAIGKKISYSPDCDTEIFNDKTARALWKIVDTGYGVCDGITQLEQYMLKQVGIESEKARSVNHVFLIIKNIELPKKDGKTIVGDTIVDPTWNITAHKFGGMPLNFCISYKKARENDIKSDGTDSKSHYIKYIETIDLDEKSIRDIFKSIGVADKNGDFPIKELLDKSKKIYEQKIPKEELLKKQFELLKNYQPEFTKCINSTMQILGSVILDKDKLNFDKCIVNRVYKKTDKKKKPVLYIFMRFSNEENKFYFLNETNSEFIELNKEEFEERFECYKVDLKNTNGKKPWKMEKNIRIKGTTTKSSNKSIEKDER